jgi:hypothetical protein
MLVIGLTIFTAASLLGGMATSSTMLLSPGPSRASVPLSRRPAPESDQRHLRRGSRAQQGAGHLHRGLGRRWLTRPHLGRRFDVVGVMALGDVHQRAHRHRHHPLGPSLRTGTASQRRTSRRRRRGVGHRRSRESDLRLHPTRRTRQSLGHAQFLRAQRALAVLVRARGKAPFPATSCRCDC